MKIKSIVSAVAATSLMALASTSAQSQILDSWQLDMTSAGVNSLNTNIGHLNLSGGGATVKQQVNGAGNVFVGARFEEFGNIFSISYTTNNVVGSGDNGAPAVLQNLGIALNNLEFVFTGLSGSVSSLAGAGFNYVFDAGVGSILLRANTAGGPVNLASFGIVQPSNGSFNNNLGAAGAVGDSTILSLITATTPNLFRDSSGNSLDPAVLASSLFLNVLTHNTIAAGAVGPAGLCNDADYGVGSLCVNVAVTSDGAADLLRVPEPESVALLGIGLLGMVAGLRRRKAKVVA